MNESEKAIRDKDKIIKIKSICYSRDTSINKLKRIKDVLINKSKL